MASGQYVFPILCAEDIIMWFRECFPDNHLGINENDFKNPQAERWQRFYQILLEAGTETNQEQLSQAQFQATNLPIFDHPEIHEESISLFTFTLAMQRFMAACGILDFKLKDIVEPKPKRTMRMVSGIINFYRFLDERYVVYQGMKAESAAVKEQHDQLVRMNDEIQSKINRIKAARAEKEPEYQQLKAEYESVTTKLAEHHKTQAVQQKTINELKAGIAEKSALNDQLKVAILNAKEEGEKLSRQIVQSPERMKNEQERKRNNLSQLKLTKEEKMHRLLELRQQVEKLEEVENNCEQGLKLISGINTEIEKEREVLGEISNIKDKIQSQKDVLRDSTAKVEQTKHMLKTKQDKLYKLNLQHQSKGAAMLTTKQQYEQEKSQFAQIQSEDHAEKQTILQQIKQLTDEGGEMNKKHEQTMGEMKGLYSQLLEQLDAYHTNLGTKWEEASQKLKTTH